MHDRRRHGLALPTCTRGCLVALWVVARARDMRSRGRSRALFGGPPVGPARIGRKFPLGSFHSEASTRKFPLGSFQSKVPTRKFPIGGLPVGPARISRPPSAAAVTCAVLPLVQAFLACTAGLLPLEVHRTLAYRRGGQRAGGSVLLDRCARRRRRRSAPHHSKGTHAAARVRGGLFAHGDRGHVLDAARKCCSSLRWMSSR